MTVAIPDGPWYQRSIGADKAVMQSDDAMKLQRIAQMRENRKPGAVDAASDNIWLNRLNSGEATFGTIRQRLDQKYGTNAATIGSFPGKTPAPTKPQFSTDPVGTPKPYDAPPPLPSLSADDFADLAARRRNASSQLEEALARRAAGESEVTASHKVLLDRLRNSFDQRRDQSMDELGARGMAFQPRGAGQMLRETRNRQSEATADAEAGKAARLAALARMVEDARRARDSELSLVEAEEVRRRSDLSRLMQGIGA